jgi:hypothetical protein
MPLALMRNFQTPQETDDYYFMSGELRVGRIYQRAIAANRNCNLRELGEVAGVAHSGHAPQSPGEPLHVSDSDSKPA